MIKTKPAELLVVALCSFIVALLVDPTTVAGIALLLIVAMFYVCVKATHDWPLRWRVPFFASLIFVLPVFFLLPALYVANRLRRRRGLANRTVLSERPSADPQRT